MNHFGEVSVAFFSKRVEQLKLKKKFHTQTEITQQRVIKTDHGFAARGRHAT